jgi:hypothetical protein
MTMAAYSFKRYLAAKRSIDDRALNRHVWETLVDALRGRSAGQVLRVLEVGAGIGTMVERLVEWELFTASVRDKPSCANLPTVIVSMTGLDALGENITVARRRLRRWAAAQTFSVTGGENGSLILERAGLHLTLDLQAIDLFEFAARERGSAWDLVIANAVLDDLDASAALPALCSLTAPGGLLYCSITFDGVTSFQPVIDPALDDRIEALYHQTMDRRIRKGEASGDSRAGRHLFNRMREAGAEVLDMGASDWVIFPGPNGYAGDDAYFLHFIVHTVHQALLGHAELDAERFSAWIARRHEQIERRELVYVAHQLDVLGRVTRDPRGGGNVLSS